ncbi:MAG: hypothetical protein ACR2HH_17045 [Chthoniobacterales bacterium]
MKRRICFGALAALAVSAFLLGGCTTPASRIADHPEIYNRLGQSDRDLVARGEIRPGLSQDAVFLAWGEPDRRSVANVHGHPAETWVYDASTTGDYGYGSFGGYGGYGGFGGYGGGFGGYDPFYGAYSRGFYSPFGGRFYRHRGYRYYGFGYGYYDPFLFSGTSIIRYPYKTISFQKRHVVAFQFLAPPSIY